MTNSPNVFKDYPYWAAETQDDVKEQLRQITNIRKDDITVIKNLPQSYIYGRKVGKIPTSSADVVSTDKIGDVSYDINYIYILVNNAGTAVWRRTALGSW